ncbi:MAG: hypothetical protein H7X93_00360 [Sphingomonadaceae bacterium]|nr:hypothetical protein [Sphingomonadaceae bacterium]
MIALGACGGSGGGDATNDSAGDRGDASAEANALPDEKEATETADVADPDDDGASAVASSPSEEIRALIIGRWTDSGDCADATAIREDGSFASPSAGEGRWTLESEYLTLAGDRETIELAVQEIDRSAMATVNPMGRIGDWTRC